MKRSVYILLLVLFLYGCSFDFFGSENEDKESEDSIVVTYTFDKDTDTKYRYEDGVLKWKEHYDYNENGECVFIKHLTPSDTLLWSYIYTWSDGNVVSESYFNNNNELSWFNTFSYNSDNLIQHNNYNSLGELQWFKSYTYSETGKIASSTSYTGTAEVQWAYSHDFDNSDRLIRSSSHSANGTRVAYIEYIYDESDRKIKEEGFGLAKSEDRYYSSGKTFGFPSTGGINTLSRNSDSISAPVIPTPPAPTLTSLSFDTLTYSWMKIWAYDNFGYTYASLNSDRLPVYLKRSAPEYLNNKPVIIEIGYTGFRVDTKTTKYDDKEILKLDFEYDSSNRPIMLRTTGEALLLPLNYSFTYRASGLPESISILNESALLQKFVYTYIGDENLIDKAKLGESIASIEHYDGDLNLIGTYIFSFDINLKKLTINVIDPENNNNGIFILQYDENGNTSSFSSYSSAGEQIWNYSYNYDEYNNRVSETVQDANNLPKLADGFNIETLFEDIKRFLP